MDIEPNAAGEEPRVRAVLRSCPATAVKSQPMYVLGTRGRRPGGTGPPRPARDLAYPEFPPAGLSVGPSWARLPCWELVPESPMWC